MKKSILMFACLFMACTPQHKVQLAVNSINSIKDKVQMTAELSEEILTVGDTVTVSITYSNVSDETVVLFKDAYLWLSKETDYFGEDASLGLTPAILYPNEKIELNKGGTYKQELPCIIQKPFFVPGELNVNLFYTAYRKGNGTDVLTSEIGKISVK